MMKTSGRRSASKQRFVASRYQSATTIVRRNTDGSFCFRRDVVPEIAVRLLVSILCHWFFDLSMHLSGQMYPVTNVPVSLEEKRIMSFESFQQVVCIYLFLQVPKWIAGTL